MQAHIDLSAALWCKSSYSNGNGGQCIEFARNLAGVVPVQDSKSPGPVLVLPATAWQAFVEYVKA